MDASVWVRPDDAAHGISDPGTGDLQDCHGNNRCPFLPPEKVVEQVKSSVKFTAPVIKKDEEVKEEDEIKLDEVQKSEAKAECASSATPDSWRTIPWVSCEQKVRKLQPIVSSSAN